MPGESSPRAMDPRPSPAVLLVCPLCFEETGQRIAIFAEFDLSTPMVTVADLVGCAHAKRFGHVGGLSPDEERRLIEAALDVWEAARQEDEDGEGDARSDFRGCA